MSSRDRACFGLVIAAIGVGLSGMASSLLLQARDASRNPVQSVMRNPIDTFPDQSGEFSVAFIDWYHDSNPNGEPPELQLAWSKLGEEGRHTLMARSTRARQGGNHTWPGQVTFTARWYFVPSPLKNTKNGLEWHTHAECKECHAGQGCQEWVPCTSSSIFAPSSDFVMTNQIPPFQVQAGGNCVNVPRTAFWPVGTLQYQPVNSAGCGPSAAPTQGHPGGGFYLIPYTSQEPNLSAVSALHFNPIAERADEKAMDVMYPRWVETSFPSGAWVATPGLGDRGNLNFYGEYVIQASKVCNYRCSGYEDIRLEATYQAVSHSWNPYGRSGVKFTVKWDVDTMVSSISLTYANALAMFASYAMTGLGVLNGLFSTQIIVPRHFVFGEVPQRHKAIYEDVFWELGDVKHGM